jgi:hypothetical protein
MFSVDSSRHEMFRTVIAARSARWYALNMMRCTEHPRVARLFCRNTYRCIHETVYQLQECRAAQVRRKRS